VKIAARTVRSLFEGPLFQSVPNGREPATKKIIRYLQSIMETEVAPSLCFSSFTHSDIAVEDDDEHEDSELDLSTLGRFHGHVPWTSSFAIRNKTT